MGVLDVGYHYLGRDDISQHYDTVSNDGKICQANGCIESDNGMVGSFEYRAHNP